MQPSNQNLLQNETADKITADMTTEEMEADLSRSKEKISKIYDVNLGAIKEYEQLKERFEFLGTQRDDLLKAIEDLQKVMRKINKITQQRFMETFTQINQKLNEVFPRLFEGGEAKLVLVEPKHASSCSVDDSPAGEETDAVEPAVRRRESIVGNCLHFFNISNETSLVLPAG